MYSSKKGMSKILGVTIAVVIIIAAALAVFGWGRTTANVVSNPSSNSPASQQNSAQPAMTKLSDSQYANYAYLISTDTLSSDAQMAVTGFNIQKASNSDGSVTYSLVAVNPEYQTQTYTLKSGQSLYFIERNLGDDAGGVENFPGDDMAVVVDANGYIVSGPGSA